MQRRCIDNPEYVPVVAIRPDVNALLTKADSIPERVDAIDLRTATARQIYDIARHRLPFINAVDLSTATAEQIWAVGQSRLPMVGFINAKTTSADRIRAAVLAVPSYRVIGCEGPPAEWMQAHNQSMIAEWYAWDAIQRKSGVAQPLTRDEAFLKYF
jgi:hypothetical protein